MPIITSLSALGALPANPSLLLAALQESLTSNNSCWLRQRLLTDPALCIALLTRFGSSGTNPLTTITDDLEHCPDQALQALLQRHTIHHHYHPPAGDQLGALTLLWQHQARLQVAAEHLGETLPPPQRMELLLTLRLLAVGSMVLLQQHPDSYPTLLQQAETATQLAATEQQQLGTSSLQVSSELLHRLAPQSLAADAVAYLLSDSRQLRSASPLLARVALAYRLALPGYAPSDDWQLLATASGCAMDDPGDLQRHIHSAANSAEQRRVRQLRDYDAAQLAAHAEQLSNFPVNGHEGDAAPWQATLDAARDMVGGGSQLLFRVTAAGQQLQAVAASHLGEQSLPELRAGLNSADSLLSLAAADGVPRIDDGRAPALVDRQLRRLLGEQPLYYLPLREDSELLAVLVTSGPATTGQTDAEWRLFASYCARRCAQTLSRQRHHEQQRQRQFDTQLAAQKHRAAELIHEVSNPLSVARNYLQVLARKLEQDGAPLQPIDAVKEEIGRIQSLINDWGCAAPPPVNPAATADLNSIVEQLASVFDSSANQSAGIQVTTQLDRSLQPFACPSEPLRQILLNLLKNAVEAQTDGGSVLIRTRAGVNLNGALHAELMIRDGGAGLPAAVLEHGVATVGGGQRGLGLAIVGRLVQRIGASISFRNPCDGGAKFVILLPYSASSSNKEL